MAGFWVSVAIYTAAAASVGTSIYQGNKQTRQIKNAAADAEKRNNEALAAAKADQDTAASQAQAQVDAKRRRLSSNETIMTNPMGIAGQAKTAKKALLGA